MASNCGRCRSIDIKHGCGWCSGVQLCTIEDQCHQGPWLQRDETCPDPSITMVSASLSRIFFCSSTLEVEALGGHRITPHVLQLSTAGTLTFGCSFFL